MTEASGAAGSSLDEPNRRALWQWVWSRARPFVGWALALGGGVALFVGWYGISGEALTAKQLPYLVSAGLTGVALFILAGVFLATDDVRRQFTRITELERKVDALYALFVEDIAATAAAPGDAASGAAATTTEGAPTLLALPTGTSYHLSGCALVAGKADATTVDPAAIDARRLRPCRVCTPPRVTNG